MFNRLTAWYLIFFTTYPEAAAIRAQTQYDKARDRPALKGR